VKYLVALGRRDEAISSLSELINKQPGRSVLFSMRGALRNAAGDEEGARADLTKALEADPGSVETLLSLAELQQGSGDPAGARATLLKAVSLEAGLTNHAASAALALARFEFDAGEHESARARLRGVLDGSPRNGAAASALMNSLLVQADLSNPSNELVDVARRASFFSRNPRARELSARFASLDLD